VPAGTGYFGGSFSDAIGFHGYVGTATAVGTNAVPCPTPENVNIVMADLSATLAQFPTITAGKPLFNTEGGLEPSAQRGLYRPGPPGRIFTTLLAAAGI